MNLGFQLTMTDAEERNQIVAKHMDTLRNLAFRAQQLEQPDKFILACVEVDGNWRYLADQLYPNANWESMRKQREHLVVSGAVSISLCDSVAKMFPDLTPTLKSKPHEGFVKCIAFGKGGCSVYELSPLQTEVQSR